MSVCVCVRVCVCVCVCVCEGLFGLSQHGGKKQNDFKAPLDSCEIIWSFDATFSPYCPLLCVAALYSSVN